ncbi:DUF305 domain-containing protein [Pseudonocardia sp. GCM10023141]|uniref:DUF305 domain-containing protein n=1 Tax=Pseudonocardia sp. GCM10023141 TaxID=3252653 RepID=UPI0036096339
MNSKTMIGALAALLSTAAIAGCGASAPTAAPSVTVTAPAPAASAAEHNNADITFVQGMIPHHTQAVAMSDLVTGRGASPQVIELATQIAQAQGPEITHMQGFLRSWNVPAAPTGEMGDHGMETGSVPPAAGPVTASVTGRSTSGRLLARAWRCCSRGPCPEQDVERLGPVAGRRGWGDPRGGLAGLLAVMGQHPADHLLLACNGDLKYSNCRNAWPAAWFVG